MLPFGIGRDAVHAVELAGLAAAVAEGGDLLERVAHDDADALVLAVGEHQMKRCSGSLENTMSQTEPAPSVFLA